MDVLEKLKTLSEKELKRKLDNNRWVKKGAIVQYPIASTLENIGEILYVVKGSNIGSYLNCALSTNPEYIISVNMKKHVRFLTYDLYKQLLFNTIISKAPIKHVAKYLEKVTASFGKDNVDISYTSSEIYINILFPEILVKNSLDMEHKLLDVYIRFRFGASNNLNGNKRLYLREIIVFRGRYSLSEWYSNYVFSHFNADVGDIVGLSRMCLGDNNSLSSVIYNAKEKEILLSNIPSLILLFLEYMKWESIEGVPYQFLTSIKKYDIKKGETPTKSEIEGLYENVIKHCSKFSYTFYTDSGENVVVSLSDESKEFVKGKIYEFIDSDETYKKFIGKQIGSDFGELIPLKSLTEDSKKRIEEMSEYKDFRFKDEMVEITVDESEDIIDLDSMPNIINPRIITGVIKIIEQGIQKVFKLEKLKNE